MKKLLCKILGCDLRFNFPSLPNKCICVRCKGKAGLDLETLEWRDVERFNHRLGTDEEIINRWFKNI
jgi:hypothetical protein